MKENWEIALKTILHHEGGYVNNPHDRGGETNLGVTKKVYQEWGGTKDMKDLTVEDVSPIYKKNYWDRCRCDDLESGFDLSVFDMAVNAGTGRSAKFVQEICGAERDGVIGNKTLALLKGISPKYAIDEFARIRSDYYASLSTYRHFGRGWDRRTEETREKSLDMVQ